MSTNLIRTAVLFGILGCAGCAEIGSQFSLAAEPATDPRARLRIVANSWVKAIPNRDCIDWESPGAGTAFGGIAGSSGYRGRSLDMPDGAHLDRNYVGEMYVAADKPITLVFSTGIESRYRCMISATFVPEARKDYEAVLALAPAELQCRITVTSIVGNAREFIPLTSPRRCK